MSGHNGTSDGSSDDDVRHDGRDGRDDQVEDSAGPSGPPRRRGRGRGRRQNVTESASQENSTRGADRYHLQDDRYRARGADQPVIMLHDARHLLDDAVLPAQPPVPVLMTGIASTHVAPPVPRLLLTGTLSLIHI